MTTADVSVAVPTTARSGASWLERWSPLGGLLFVIGAVALALSPAGGETGETAAEVVSFARSNDAWMVVASIFGLAALVLTAWFVAGLYTRLRKAGTITEAVLALVGGVAFSLLFFVALTIWSAPLIDIEQDEAMALAQASAFLTIDDVGWVALGGAGIGAGLMAIAASLGALRAQVVPAWAGWLGVALGVASFATVTFVGIFAWLAWMLVVSVGLLAKAER